MDNIRYIIMMTKNMNYKLIFDYKKPCFLLFIH